MRSKAATTPFQLAIVILIAVIGYSNTFQVPFLFDDQSSITENPVVHSLSAFFGRDGGYDYLPNRVVGYLTFALNYAVGGDTVIGYHAVNLAIHIANGLLVYALATLIIRTPLFGSRFEVRSSDADLHPSPFTLYPFLPLLTALLFVVHPVQTQAVTYIVQRLTSLATLFYLACLICHLRWRLSRQAGAPFLSRPVLPWWLLSLACALLAMKTKEIAFTLPLAALLAEGAFFGRLRLRQLPELAPLLLTMAIIPLTMINILKPTSDVLSDVGKTTGAHSILTPWNYFCTEINVLATYLRLLVLPIDQNLDYDFPISTSLREPRTALSFLLLLSLLGCAVYLWTRSRVNGVPSPESRVPSPGLYRLSAFGMLWFFLTISVESSVIPIADVIFEHRLYLPSVGFFLAVAAAAALGAERMALRRPGLLSWLAVAGGTVIIALTAATITRNRVWSDGITLWSDTVQKSPNNPRAYNALGVCYQRQNRHPEAMVQFREAIRVFPGYAEGYYNLGVSYQALGEVQTAIARYERSLELGMDAPQAYTNLGVTYAALGRFDRAVSAFSEAVRREPGNIVMRRNLAGALMQQGRLAEAEREYRQVLKLNPGDAKAERFLHNITRGAVPSPSPD